MSIWRTELLPATVDDYAVIQNMARFYAYDMSRDCGQELKGWEFPKDGLYECSDFRKYLEGNDKHAFLIKINGELAGFAFVNKLEVMPEVDWNMGEFFIVAKFQRSGIGRMIAKQLFDQFPGEWSVGAIPQNARALNFWRKIIAEYTHDKFHEIEKTSEQLKTAEHPDPYPMIILRFKASQSIQKDNDVKEIVPLSDLDEKLYKFLDATNIDAEIINDKMDAFNGEQLSFKGQVEIFKNYVVKHNDKIIAGIRGVLYLGTCLVINVLFVDEEYRHKGLGQGLLEKIENEAKLLGVKIIHLDTFDFQAKDFYIKYGYEIFGVLKDCPEGHERYYLKKDLT